MTTETNPQPIFINGRVYWEDEDGFRAPAIMGADDEGNPPSTESLVQGAIESAQGSQGTEQTVEGETQDGNGQGSGEPDYSLAAGFLEGVPDEHKEILEPYVKKWDAGVTRRFQELNSQLKPYQELGEYERLQEAQEIYKLLDTQPEMVYQILHQQYGKEAADAAVGNQQTPQQQATGQQVLENELGIPKEFLDTVNNKFQQQQQVLEQLAQIVLGNQQMTQQQQEDQQLTEYLGLLKQEFGEYDEDFVLTKMAAGMKGEEAVKAYQNLVQQVGAKAAQNSTQPILGGGGGAPGNETRSVSEMANKEVQNLVKGIMEQAHKE